jgi:hypothetical protein
MTITSTTSISTTKATTYTALTITSYSGAQLDQFQQCGGYKLLKYIFHMKCENIFHVKYFSFELFNLKAFHILEILIANSVLHVISKICGILNV